MVAGHTVMSPRIMVQPWGAGADICPQLGSGLWYKWCECGSRWESGRRISQTSSEDSRAIGVYSCLYANTGLLTKGYEVQHFQSVLVAAECGLCSCLVPLVGDVCDLRICSTGPLSRDFPSSGLWDHGGFRPTYLLMGTEPSLADMTPNMSRKFFPSEWILKEICFKGLQMRLCGSSVNTPSACYFYLAAFTFPVNLSSL